MSVCCHRGQRTFGELPPGVFRNRIYRTSDRTEVPYGNPQFSHGLQYFCMANRPPMPQSCRLKALRGLFQACQLSRQNLWPTSQQLGVDMRAILKIGAYPPICTGANFFKGQSEMSKTDQRLPRSLDLRMQRGPLMRLLVAIAVFMLEICAMSAVQV